MTGAAVVADSTGRIAYLDGLRAVAVSAVVAVHLAHPYFPHFQGGYVGVDVFFVLSGYIITTILWRRREPSGILAAYADFIRKRIWRLYPALIGLLVLGTLLVALFRAPVTVPAALEAAGWAAVQGGPILRALDAHAMLPFSHTWTLAVEWLFYLVWPLVLLTAHKRGVRPGRLAVAATATAALMYAMALQTTPDWFYYGPLARSAQLLAGCALALALLRRTVSVPSWLGTAGIVAGLAAVVGWTLLGSHYTDAAYRTVGFPAVTIASVAIIASGACAQTSKGTALLSVAPLGLIGRTSYSLYLWHMVPLHILDIDQMPISPFALGALGAAMVVILATASFVILERPFLTNRAAALAKAPPTSAATGPRNSSGRGIGSPS